MLSYVSCGLQLGPSFFLLEEGGGGVKGEDKEKAAFWGINEILFDYVVGT